MSAIKLKIDNQEVEVPDGSTIMDAVRKAGSCVPALCHHPDLKGIGSCILCIAPAKGMYFYTAARNIPTAEDGMVVHTRTEEMLEMERHTLETVANMPELKVCAVNVSKIRGE